VDAPADAWPAPEAITAFFGRGGKQENRFAQEDRELGSDRIISYHLPGQELAELVTPVTDAPGPRAVHDSLFLPAEARHAYQARFLGGSVRIEVELPPPDPPRPRLLADDVADRQRRRKTWTQNLERYALPEKARVFVTVEGSPALRQMFGDNEQSRPQTARAA